MHTLPLLIYDISLSKVLGNGTVIWWWCESVTCTQSDILCGWIELLFLICPFLLCGLCQVPLELHLLSASLVWNNTHRVQQNYIKDQLKRKTSSTTSSSAWLGKGCQNKGNIEWCFPQRALLSPGNLRFRDFKSWRMHHVRRPDRPSSGVVNFLMYNICN